MSSFFGNASGSGPNGSFNLASTSIIGSEEERQKIAKETERVRKAKERRNADIEILTANPGRSQSILSQRVNAGF